MCESRSTGMLITLFNTPARVSTASISRRCTVVNKAAIPLPLTSCTAKADYILSTVPLGACPILLKKESVSLCIRIIIRTHFYLPCPQPRNSGAAPRNSQIFPVRRTSGEAHTGTNFLKAALSFHSCGMGPPLLRAGALEQPSWVHVGARSPGLLATLRAPLLPGPFTRSAHMAC